jgi:hypothetical protein
VTPALNHYNQWSFHSFPKTGRARIAWLSHNRYRRYPVNRWDSDTHQYEINCGIVTASITLLLISKHTNQGPSVGTVVGD